MATATAAAVVHPGGAEYTGGRTGAPPARAKAVDSDDRGDDCAVDNSNRLIIRIDGGEGWKKERGIDLARELVRYFRGLPPFLSFLFFFVR